MNERPSDLASSIMGRRSVRSYEQREVARAAILQMLEAARWAPSPHGRQPWRFAVLTRAAEPNPRVVALAEAMEEEWRSHLSLDRQDAITIDRRLARSRERLLNAPAIIVPCLYLEDLDRYPDEARQQAETTMAIQSLGCAVQNMLLMAYSMGLDCGWMCAPLFCPNAVRRAVDLDTTLLPQALITVGYAACDPVRRDRLPLETLILSYE